MVSCTEFNRLPKNVVPVNYALELHPDIKNFTFTGKLVVDLNVIYIFLCLINNKKKNLKFI